MASYKTVGRSAVIKEALGDEAIDFKLMEVTNYFFKEDESCYENV
jgi:hypothetical protein